MGNLEGMGNQPIFPGGYNTYGNDSQNLKKEMFNPSLESSTSNQELISRIKNIHVAFQHIGFDKGISTALNTAKEALTHEDKEYVLDRFGLNEEQLKTISYESISNNPNKLAMNQRTIEIMNAIFLISNHDPLEEMEVTAQKMILESTKFN